MAEDNNNSNVAQLDNGQSSESQGYWLDAWGRLVKNRLAVVGLAIIVINMLIAVFAPFITPEGIDDQNTDEADAAPAWVMTLFPVLEPRDEIFDAGIGTILVESGETVSEGDLLIDFTDANLQAVYDGTVFIDERRVYLVSSDIDIPRFDTSGINNSDLPENFSDVQAGDTLFGSTTAPITGTVYRANGELIIQPQTSWRRNGEDQVENLQLVEPGDVLMITEEGEEITTPYAGRVFIGRNNIDLALVPPLEFEVPEGSEIEIRDGRGVDAGDILFDDVVAPISGDAYIVDNTILIPQAEEWLQSDGGVSVSTGDVVTAGDLLIDLSDRNVYANMDGTVFLEDEETVLLSSVTPQRETLPAGAELNVVAGQPVTAGDILFDNVSADIQGVVYILDDELLIRQPSPGYVALRNEYPLGADYLGRDLWSRIAFGARVSLLAAFIGPMVSLAVGIPYGLISGYIGGRVDNLMMRFVDLMYAFPTLLLIILLMAFFRSSAASTQPGTFIFQMGELDRATGGVFFIFLGIGLTSWMRLARLTRGQVLSAREADYVLAARALGQTTPRIMMRHIMPNILGPLVISETLTIPSYIRFEAFLSFIGLGVNAPTPSWGGMISDGARVLVNYPHEALFPALALFLIMFAFNFLGDGLRDALDPRMRGND